MEVVGSFSLGYVGRDVWRETVSRTVPKAFLAGASGVIPGIGSAVFFF